MNHGLSESSKKRDSAKGPTSLSPLLANRYLSEIDKELKKRGHKFVRYADDCNIYIKSQRAVQRVLKIISDFLESQLKVTVKQKKTRVGSPLRLKFLGFSLGAGHGGAYVRPATEPKKEN